MSEAVRELRLRVVYEGQEAAAASAQHHAQERANVKATAKAQTDAAKQANALLKQFYQDEARLAKQAAQERIKADKDAFRAWKDGMAQQHREAMGAFRDRARAAKEAARDEAGLNKELNTLLRSSEKETFRDREQINRQLNSLLKESARDEERLAKQAARAKAGAAKEAFAQWKAGADRQHAEAMKNWSDQQAAVKEHRNEVADLIKTFAGFSAVKGVASAIGDEFKRANEYVEKTSKEFADVRHAMQQVAALRGEKPSDTFTMRQVEAAGRAGLTPGDWVKAQESFLNPAGAQVGDQPGAKMSDKEAEEYQLRVARLTAAKLGGENAGLGMEMAGSILEQSKSHLTPDQAMAKFNPAFEVLQRGRIDLRRAMPMMSQIMAHNVSPTEAATLLNVVAPASPGEEVTSAEAAMRAIEKMRVSGKGKEFGVTDKMGQYEAIKAFSKNIAARDAAMRAAGKSEEEAEVEIARQLKTAGVAADIREQCGLVRGMARNGIGLGAFDLYERVGRETRGDYDRGAVASFEASDEGQAAKRRAVEALMDARTGLRDQSAKAVREEARNLAKHNREYGVTGDKHNTFQAGPNGVGISTEDVKYRSQNNVNEEIRDLLRLIAEGQRKQTEAIIKSNPAAAGAGIMARAALPPMPSGRM